MNAAIKRSHRFLGRAFPVRALAVGAFITVVAAAALGWNCWTRFRTLFHVNDQQARIEESLATVAHLDEMMTMSVRLAASTGEAAWEAQYNLQQQQRQNAINETLALLPETLMATMEGSFNTVGRLRPMEQEVFTLARAGNLTAAAEHVFSNDYETRRQQYRRVVASGTMRLRDSMIGILDDARRQAYTVGAITAASGAAIIAVWAGVFKVVNQNMSARRRAEEALQAAHDELETRVAQRTENLAQANRQLEEEIARRCAAQEEAEHAHRQLVETSRRVGMAEVATGVLHNVGNVLNSVNVSTGVIRDRLAQSAGKDVARAARLIAEHESDLPRYIADDPQGRHLPRFLVEVGGTLEQEQQALESEIARLAQSVEHIRAIINVQQTAARVCDVVETVPLGDVIDQALTIHSASLDRHGVHVDCRIELDQPVRVDRHRLLQILVNLISNAKHAAGDADVENKLVTITLRASSDGEHALIEVRDNGVGIAPENLTRIFSHGFTTRRGGHGFGLHAAALAAREMDGNLTAHSDGPGKGAIFTIELPLRQTAEVTA